MQYISKVVNSSELENIFNLPVEYRDKKVEVFIVPAMEYPTTKVQSNSLYGILSDFSKSDLIL